MKLSALALLLLSFFPQPPPDAPQPSKPAETSAPSPASLDHWYVIEMFGQRSGHAHFAEKEVQHDGEPAVRRTMVMRTEMARLNAGRTEQVVLASRALWLEQDHGLVRIESRLDLGAGESITTVDVQGETAKLRTLSPQGREQVQEIAWNPNVLAPGEIQDRLLRLLHSEADVIEFQTFSFEAGNRVLDVQLRVLERLPDGGLVVEQDAVGLGLQTRETYDANGLLLRQEVGPMVMRLATRKEALAPVGTDLAAFERLSVNLDRPLPGARQLRRAVYRVLPRDQAPLHASDIFAQDERQTIAHRSFDGAREEVLIVEVPSLEPLSTPEEACAGCLEPSNLIESDDPAIQKVARDVSRGAANEIDVARRLEEWVHDNVDFSGAGIGLGTASQTLESRDGDCTENAFLLTALLRAAGIPARVVVGLVHSGGDGRFLYHAWAEAYLRDRGRWLALDSAIFAPRVDATHLAMGRTTAGDEGVLLEIALPLLGHMGRFDLAWVEED